MSSNENVYKIPWPGYSLFFEYYNFSDHTGIYTLKCKLCNKLYKGDKTSNSNFKKHLKVCFEKLSFILIKILKSNIFIFVSCVISLQFLNEMKQSHERSVKSIFFHPKKILKSFNQQSNENWSTRLSLTLHPKIL